MKKQLLLALILLSGCNSAGGLYSDWTYAGLTFDGTTRTFSGLAPTTAAQLPTAGSSTYTGEYRAASAGGSGQGDATLNATFGLFSSVSLSLTGYVTGSSTGIMSGTGFVGSTPSLTFLGEFYGSDASVAAGEFTKGAVVGSFIVNK